MKRDRLLVAIVSIGIGFAAGYAWHAIPMSVVSTEGTLYENSHLNAPPGRAGMKNACCRRQH